MPNRKILAVLIPAFGGVVLVVISNRVLKRRQLRIETEKFELIKSEQVQNSKFKYSIRGGDTLDRAISEHGEYAEMFFGIFCTILVSTGFSLNEQAHDLMQKATFSGLYLNFHSKNRFTQAFIENIRHKIPELGVGYMTLYYKAEIPARELLSAYFVVLEFVVKCSTRRILLINLITLFSFFVFVSTGHITMFFALSGSLGTLIHYSKLEVALNYKILRILREQGYVFPLGVEDLFLIYDPGSGKQFIEYLVHKIYHDDLAKNTTIIARNTSTLLNLTKNISGGGFTEEYNSGRKSLILKECCKFVIFRFSSRLGEMTFIPKNKKIPNNRSFLGYVLILAICSLKCYDNLHCNELIDYQIKYVSDPLIIEKMIPSSPESIQESPESIQEFIRKPLVRKKRKQVRKILDLHTTEDESEDELSSQQISNKIK